MKNLCSFLTTLFILAVHLFAVQADEAITTRQVLLPNDMPAVGASVLLCLADNTGQWHQSEVKTDKNGKFTAVLKQESSWPPDFALINVPGCAIQIVQLFKITAASIYHKPVKLSREYLIQGQVLDADGVPVAGAEVSIASLIGPLNFSPASAYSNYTRLYVSGELKLPRALRTWTDAKGMFSLRGVRKGIAEPMFSLRGLSQRGMEDAQFIVATAQIQGKAQMGGVGYKRPSFFQADKTQASARFARKPLIICLKPTSTVSGRVVHGLTGKPLAGVRVRLEWFTPLPVPATITTGDDGEFEFQRVPAGQPIEVSARHPHYPAARIPLFKGNSSEARTKSFSGLLFQMHPLVEVNVTLKDTDTNLPPVVPLGLFVALMDGRTILDPAGKQEWFFSRKDNASSLADGTFSMPVAVGTNRISLAGQGNEAQAYSIVEPEKVKSLNIEETAGQNLLLKLRRARGLLIKIEAPNPALLEQTILHIRNQHDREETQSARSGYAFCSGYKLGDKITIRVLRNNPHDNLHNAREILPPTEIVTDPKNWPFTIRLPQ